MKLHYFRQQRPDDDDVALREMMYLGVVPETCLLGGSIAKALWLRDEVPCHRCQGPRPICKGSPAKEPDPHAVSLSHTRALLTGERDELETLLKKLSFY